SPVYLPFPSLLSSSPYGDPRDLHSFPTRRSSDLHWRGQQRQRLAPPAAADQPGHEVGAGIAVVQGVVEVEHDQPAAGRVRLRPRSEEHTSELQSRENLVCRLLLEKKKKNNNIEIQ